MREHTNDVLSGNLKNKLVTFKLIKRRTKPALAGRFYPSIKRLPSSEEVYDSKKDITRTIRYAVGESSIYKDEQPLKVVLGDIVFQNGYLRVEHTNPTLLKYLATSNLNVENPDRKTQHTAVYIEMNPDKEAGLSMEKEISQAQAISTVAGMDFDDLKGYAKVLGVNVNLGAKEIRHNMIVLAKAEPTKFLNGLDDPVVKRQQIILNGIEMKIISAGTRGVHWIMGDKKQLITPVPPGMVAVQWFAEWTMGDKRGEEVFEEIKKRLKKLDE